MGTWESASGVLNNMLRLSILCVTALSCSANNPVKTSVKSQLHQNKDVVKSRLSDAKLSLNSAQDQFNKTILSKFNNADLQKYGIQGSSEMQGLGDGTCGLIIECDLDPIDCGLKIECDLNLFSSDDPPPASNSNSNSRSATELQGLGGGDCGLIFLCDLGPLDCNEQTYDANDFFIIHASTKRPRREICLCVEISRRKPLKIAKMRRNLVKITRFFADFTLKTVNLVQF